MRRFRPHAWGLLFALVLLFTLSVAAAQQPATTPDPAAPPAVAPAVATQAPVVTGTTGEQTYVIQPGDTLFRIAVRFRTTVRALAAANNIVNPALIYAGQTIRIPGSTAPATATPSTPPTAAPTADPGATTTYTVVRGDTLFRIAIRFRTTVSQLVALNNLPNRNFIFVGQVLRVPAAGQTVAVVSTPALAATEEQGGGAVALLPPAPTPNVSFAQGIEAFLVDQDVAGLTGQITSLGVEWVKQQINWRDFEPVQGQIDFTTLDNIVNTLNASGLKILLTVTAAPAWTRADTLEDGPPNNLTDYATFITALASRYAGKVQAYQIWNEPNLRSQWSCTPSAEDPRFCPTPYIVLLRSAYGAVKAADPNALVISAGLAPTGFNDPRNAFNDRGFLTALYQNGLADVSDAIGVHPLGWANPPDAMCCSPAEGVLSHFEDRSFYFLDTLNDYRQIMIANNDSATSLWVTKFGWGTSEDTDAPADVYLTYTSLAEQAAYDPRAFGVGQGLGFVGPMFLSNLNGCQSASAPRGSCYYSLIGPAGAPRPVFSAVASGGAPVAPAIPTATPEVFIFPEATQDTSGLMTEMTPEPLPPDMLFPTTDPLLPAETPELTSP